MSAIPDEPDRRAELIATLHNHPAWDALRSWVHEQRDGYFQALGRDLFDKTQTVTEVDLAYKRGFFYGMNRLLNQPLIDAKTLMRETEESEADG